jgi:hypothetical protein
MNDLVSEIANQIVPYAPPVHLNAALYFMDDVGQDRIGYELYTSFSRSTTQPKGELTVIERHPFAEPKPIWPCWTRSGLKLYLDNLEVPGCDFCLVFWTGDNKHIPSILECPRGAKPNWKSYFSTFFTAQPFKAVDDEDHPRYDKIVKEQHKIYDSDTDSEKESKREELKEWKARMDKYMRQYDAILTCATDLIYSFVGGVECDTSALSIHCV